MQVSSDKFLSDQESINKAQYIILNSYLKHKKSDIHDYELVNKIANDYNPGGYGGRFPKTIHY